MTELPSARRPGVGSGSYDEIDSGRPLASASGDGELGSWSDGRVSSNGEMPTLVASLNPAGAGNWQSAVREGDYWYVGHALRGDRAQVIHRLDSKGEQVDQMTVVGAAHTTSFAVVDDTVYATYGDDVVTFPYRAGTTITRADTKPTGLHGQISIDPSHTTAVVRSGNHYRAYDLATLQPVGEEVVTPRGMRQGFSVNGDALYVLSGATDGPARVDSYSLLTGRQTGTQDVTLVGPGRHREPEGMFGDLMGVKTGVGDARRLEIYRLDTAQPGTVSEEPSAVAPAGPPDSHAAPVDGDDDGLMDWFERLAGTDPNMVDTDLDGVSDANQAFVFRTAPARLDTIGVPDGLERATETDPLPQGSSDGTTILDDPNPLTAGAGSFGLGQDLVTETTGDLGGFGAPSDPEPDPFD